MMLQATPKNIGWLLTQLYEAKQRLREEVSDPVFVLLTQNKADRLRVEEKIRQYFQEKYGILAHIKRVVPEGTHETVSGFCFPEIGCRVVLIDIELEKEP